MTQHRDAVDEVIMAWQRERPDLPLHATAVISRVWRLAHLFGEHRRRLLADADIDPAILDLLSTLRRAGAPYRLDTREIARRSMVTASAISQRLQRAERDGLIDRAPDPEQPRRILVTLTARGLEVVDRYVETVMHGETALLRALPDDRLDDLSGALRELMGIMAPLAAETPRTQVGQS